MPELVIVGLAVLAAILSLGLLRERRLRLALQALLTRLLNFRKGAHEKPSSPQLDLEPDPSKSHRRL